MLDAPTTPTDPPLPDPIVPNPPVLLDVLPPVEPAPPEDPLEDRDPLTVEVDWLVAAALAVVDEPAAVFALGEHALTADAITASAQTRESISILPSAVIVLRRAGVHAPHPRRGPPAPARGAAPRSPHALLLEAIGEFIDRQFGGS